MLKLEQKSSSNRFCARFDFVLWALLSVVPLLAWLIYLVGFNQTTSPITFADWLSTYFGFGYVSNPFYSALSALFNSTSGRFPLFYTSWLAFFTWFCTVEVMHICLDVLLFIVRLAHKWIGGLIS